MTFIDSDYLSNMPVHLALIFFSLFLHIDILNLFNLEFSKANGCPLHCQTWLSPPTSPTPYFFADDIIGTSKDVTLYGSDCLLKPPLDPAKRVFAVSPDGALNILRRPVESSFRNPSQEIAKLLLERPELVGIDPLASQDLQDSILHISGGLPAGIVQTSAGRAIGSLALPPDGVPNYSPLSIVPSLEDASYGVPDIWRLPVQF